MEGWTVAMTDCLQPGAERAAVRTAAPPPTAPRRAAMGAPGTVRAPARPCRGWRIAGWVPPMAALRLPLYLILCVAARGAVADDASPRRAAEKGAVSTRFERLVVDGRPYLNHRKPKVIGDFANDRNPGIAAQAGPDGFAIYRPPCFERYLISSQHAASGDEDAQVADMNGDGALDIVVGGLSGNTYWLENPLRTGRDPYRSSWPAHVIGTGRASHDVVVGDVFRSGTIDVATESGIWHRVAPEGAGAPVRRARGGWRPTSWSLINAIPRSDEGTSLADILGDGYLDLIAPYRSAALAWFENPAHHGGDPYEESWTPHVIDAAPGFSAAGGGMTTATADLNGDGRIDVVMAPMYAAGRLVWYEAPEQRRRGTWVRHVIGDASYVHQGSLRIADFDGDGSLDIGFAEQEQSATRRIGIWYHRGNAWRLSVLARSGGHNIKAGRVGDDRLPSLLTANHGYTGVANPLELFRHVRAGGRIDGTAACRHFRSQAPGHAPAPP